MYSDVCEKSTPTMDSTTVSELSPLMVFALFLFVLFVYHSGELIMVYAFNRSELSFDSLLLSREYLIAMSIAVTEYWIEVWIFPSFKTFDPFTVTWYISVCGFLLLCFGDVCRKFAMYTAGTSFTHLIKEERRKEHKLIVGGVYKYMRHPGYFGWFLWSISTQIFLLNPVSFLAFVWASWTFFADRVPYEEYHLIKMFGNQYLEYSRRTWSGIPFVP